jgi:SAM-dependent methyltransferase
MAGLGFRRTFGIDISAEQVALARVRNPGVEQGDAFEFLSRQTEQFDVVLAFDIVEHFTVAEALRFLDALHRVMPPGGLLVIKTPNGDAPLCGPVFIGDLTHETLFTPHSLRHLLGAADFELISFREHAPRPRDLRSTVRWVLWQCIRQIYRLLHLAEAGSSPSPIYTRVFRTLARRR